MGVKKQNNLTTEQPEQEWAATAPPESARPDARRDADRMDVRELPVRSLPQSMLMSRSNKFQVIFADGILEDIRKHGTGSPDIEVCGVLVGTIYRDDFGPYCYIKANIRGQAAPGRDTQVTFTSETWTLIHETMDSKYTDDRIVGWYHTHPGFGIFLSGMDLFIQDNFFNEPWQVAFVDDPKGGDRGVFVWQNGLSVRRQHLVEADPAKASLDSIAAAARIRTVQRALNTLKLKFRWLLFIAIVWNILLVAGLLWTGKTSVTKIRSVFPADWNSRVDSWIAKVKGQ
jgi:proteasome lid subunit RPN8/RPN11